MTLATLPVRARHIRRAPCGYHRIPAMVRTHQAQTVDSAFAAGEEHSLKMAYDALGGVVFGLCRRVLSAPQAEEVTQDVFVNAWRKRDQFDPRKGSLAAWIVGITKRRIIDQLRSERRHSDRRADLQPNDATADTLVSTEPDVEAAADRMLVATALNGLSERPRQVIELAYIHDLTHQEIADQTGIPLGTIKSDIRRGLETIRGQLESGNG